METIDFFESTLGYQMDEFQRVACGSVLAGNSVLVSSPTGSGKSTVAEFAIMLARRETDREVIYTAPIKALSNQKHSELVSRYGSDQVGLLTGDVSLNVDAPIKVMTTEVLRNICYDAPEKLARLHSVILDEVHFLGDAWRGPVWEEIILQLPQHVQIVALSATVANAQEIGDWMAAVRGKTEVIIAGSRPVPLYRHVLTKKELLSLTKGNKLNPEITYLKPLKRVRSRGAAPVKQHNKPLLTDVISALQQTELLPAIMFVFSRKGCEKAVSRCIYEGITLTTAADRKIIAAAAQQVRDSLTPEQQHILRINTWIKGLERGVAAHHAGMLPQCKAVVEELFQKRILKLVFATETLALGINMPAKAVVLESLKKFNGIERTYLTSSDFTQLTGRAGRRGIDSEGHAIIVWDDNLDLDVVSELAKTKFEPVHSAFRPSYNMVVNLLATRTVSQVTAVLERSLAQFQIDRSLVSQAEQLRSMKRSLEGYRAAANKNTGEDSRRWHKRANKLARQISRLEKDINRLGAGIVREFERVMQLLINYDYLRVDPHNQDILTLSVWGRALTKVHGDNALLALEAIRNGLCDRLNSREFAAFLGCLTFEERRNDDYTGAIKSAEFKAAFAALLELEDTVYTAEKKLKSPFSQLNEGVNGRVVYAWASRTPLDEILATSGLNVGDFLRWIKQTADLASQLIAAFEAMLSHSEELDVTEKRRLLALQDTARQAKRDLVYGLVESSMQL